jgi:hypothetical protein
VSEEDSWNIQGDNEKVSGTNEGTTMTITTIMTEDLQEGGTLGRDQGRGVEGGLKKLGVEVVKRSKCQ